ncbi:MAG: YeeE/YedE family protein [Gammaproteobacteria bacterium]|nr:YeeE/YedE family protein [Gammaproteobacteria bacterium]
MDYAPEYQPESHRHPLFKSIWLTALSFSYAYRANILSLILGILFGFLLSRTGATTFDFHAKLFLFENLQLLIVIGTSMVTTSIGLVLLKRYHVNSLVTGTEVDFVKKPYQKGLIGGSVLFGIGWAMTASCPGTIAAMMGEGKISGLFVISGLLLGTMAYGVLQAFISHEARHSEKSKE